MSGTRSVPFQCREESGPQSKPSKENWHVFLSKTGMFPFQQTGKQLCQNMTNNGKIFHIPDPRKVEEHCNKQLINIPGLYPFPINISLPTPLLPTKFTCAVSLGHRFWSCFYCFYTGFTALISVSFLLSYPSLSKSRLRLSLLGWDFFFFFYFLN